MPISPVPHSQAPTTIRLPQEYRSHGKDGPPPPFACQTSSASAPTTPRLRTCCRLPAHPLLYVYPATGTALNVGLSLLCTCPTDNHTHTHFSHTTPPTASCSLRVSSTPDQLRLLLHQAPRGQSPPPTRLLRFHLDAAVRPPTRALELGKPPAIAVKGPVGRLSLPIVHLWQLCFTRGLSQSTSSTSVPVLEYAFGAAAEPHMHGPFVVPNSISDFSCAHPIRVFPSPAPGSQDIAKVR